MSLPADLDASKVTTHGFGDGFKVSDVKVSGKTVSVTFALSDPDAIKTYSDLEKIVDAGGGGDGWMKLTVPGVVLDKDAEIGAHHTIVGTVDGSFGATAESEAGTHKVFSFTWKGVPKTGDATLPAGAVGVMVLGGAAALAIGLRLRRRRQE